MSSDKSPRAPIHPDPHGHLGAEVEVPHLEIDESVPPRPEEDVADAGRTAPEVS